MRDWGVYRNFRVEQRTQGFTTIELLVSLSIVGILAALLLGAVQRARESTRRIQCSNQLKQIALATQMFQGAHRIVPSNGGPSSLSVLVTSSGSTVQPFTFEIATATQYYWGVAEPNAAVAEQPGSWLYSVLPYVEQNSLFRHPEFGQEVGIYRCPSRPRGDPSSPVTDQYAVYDGGGGGLRFSKSDYAGNDQVIQNRPAKIRWQDLRDGLTYTILAAEKAYDFEVHQPTTWYWDEPFWLGGSKGTARSGTRIVDDGRQIAFRDNWGSAHAGGAVFAFADGRTTFIGVSTDESILSAAMTISGNENSPAIE